MRHRLIPAEERQAMHKEYYVRVAIVSVWALAVAVAAGAAALFPADIRARTAEHSAIQVADAAKNAKNPAELDAASAQLAQASAQLAALGADPSPRFSAVIRSIVAIRAQVLLSSLSLSRQGSTTIAVTIQGVAPTRDELISFKSRLEALSPGATVDLPISLLAKDANVPFTLKLTENQP